MKNIKKALENGEVVFGATILSSDPTCVEIAGYAGYDFVFIDSEHAPASPLGKEMGELIRAAYAADVTPIVRIIDRTDFSQIRKVLDLGARGIIAPLLSTKEEAEFLVDTCFYPPEGHRGSCPCTRAARFGMVDWNEYAKKMNENLVILPLIESAQGVNNLEEICSVKGLTGFLYGHFDLAMDLGIKIDPESATPLEKQLRENPIIEGYFDDVIRIATKHGLYVACHTGDGVESAKVVKRGARIVLTGVDTCMLAALWKDFLEESKAKINKLEL
jgi:4-hydroxy-2-oxoheptanedioate aldolase